jgi:hypothetical protein
VAPAEGEAAADIVMLDIAPGAAARIAGDRIQRRVARALSRLRSTAEDSE